ncbi:MAG: 30S ribosomal protein S12 methylthiotransferase RimO [Magnetococcales bacterium]|nr:30S ribosomal protein S12 methylthiotransferase RimO [Magnetococcales bacterium]
MKSRGKVGVISLGCPKNQVDTETMLGRFVDAGYGLTPDPNDADLLVVNTCGFIADAVEESREAIREMAEIKAAHPGKRLIVTGCLSQRLGESLMREIPEIDLMTGTGQFDRMIPLLERPSIGSIPIQPVEGDHGGSVGHAEIGLPKRAFDEEASRVLTTRPHTAYVKIAEGCNASCAFCVIPQLRGPFRSRQPEEVEREVRRLVSSGVREITLISQDTTMYGRDLAPRTSLADLLGRLNAIEELTWIRMQYLYPTLVTDALLDAVAGFEKVVPYFDIPLQHSHSDVLRRMRRAERGNTVRDLVKRIRAKVPDASIRSTFIVGFPGETEEEFKDLDRFLEEVHLDHVGVFLYSDEKDAPAHAFSGKIPMEIAERRRETLMRRQMEISRLRLKEKIGSIIPVMVDGTSLESEFLLEGRTVGQAPEVDGLVILNQGYAEPGEVVSVQITDAFEYDLVGEILDVDE